VTFIKDCSVALVAAGLLLGSLLLLGSVLLGSLMESLRRHFDEERRLLDAIKHLERLSQEKARGVSRAPILEQKEGGAT
jgi:hypothetical protein